MRPLSALHPHIVEKRPHQFNLTLCDHITHIGLRRVVDNLTRLQRLIIRSCNLVANDLFTGTPWECTELAELDISYLDIESSALIFISNMTSLKSLDICGVNCNISRDAILSFTKLQKLRTLILYVNSFVNDDIIEELAKSMSLANLSVIKISVSKACSDKLKFLYPRIHILWCE
jgi:hypothetical protein